MTIPDELTEVQRVKIEMATKITCVFLEVSLKNANSLLGLFTTKKQFFEQIKNAPDIGATIASAIVEECIKL